MLYVYMVLWDAIFTLSFFEMVAFSHLLTNESTGGIGADKEQDRGA